MLLSAAIVTALGGIFIVATLIGTITSGLEGTIEEFRKGKSKVLEENHTLILGWSPKVFTTCSSWTLVAVTATPAPRSCGAAAGRAGGR